jgi:hypothetical protein
MNPVMVLNCVHCLVAQLIHANFFRQKEEVLKANGVFKIFIHIGAFRWQLWERIPIDVVDQVPEGCVIIFRKMHFTIRFFESTIEYFGEVIGTIA